MHRRVDLVFFFFNDTATTEIYTLSLHDALPISSGWATRSEGSSTSTPTSSARPRTCTVICRSSGPLLECGQRSEEHTSELQSRQYLVCRLLLEKKKLKDTLLNAIQATLSFAFFS